MALELPCQVVLEEPQQLLQVRLDQLLSQGGESLFSGLASQEVVQYLQEVIEDLGLDIDSG